VKKLGAKKWKVETFEKVVKILLKGQEKFD
jgi:hypothetical protein